MYEFLGRKLNISEEKLKEYEYVMYGPLTDDAVAWYIKLEHQFNPIQNPDKLRGLTDEQITASVLKHMESEMEPMRPISK